MDLDWFKTAIRRDALGHESTNVLAEYHERAVKYGRGNSTRKQVSLLDRLEIKRSSSPAQSH